MLPEARFKLNDEFEIKEKANRRINFSNKATPFYKANVDISK